MSAAMRILVVVQRYGTEVVGGSESHARIVAERLARTHDVEVATTTAVDHWTWGGHYATGTTKLNGVRVHRFAVVGGRDERYKEIERTVLFEEHTLEDEYRWLRAQGPHTPELLEFLHRQGAGFEAVLFYTYIYEPTALGLPLVPERAALVSTAHDELPLRLAPYRALFQLPRAFGALTPEELALIRREFKNDHIPAEILGIGLDPPPAPDGQAFLSRRDLRHPIVLYVGQVTEAKAVDELLAMWSGYTNSLGEGTLVLAGNVLMDIPRRDDVVVLGRVSEAEKWAALAAADALVLPSHLESLGIVLLEAWQVGTPVLVPAWNAVTAGQVARAGGGLAYATREAFPDALGTLLADGKRRGEAGRAWVERECAWDAFDARVQSLVQMAAFIA
ncbi:MAG: glycosyltransferase family 4 protein [Chloroflexi bacterium]|nr:glycosyltransferase family 4 protein [Chloroflexota bacterium]